MKYTFEAFTPCASRKEAKYRFLACALDGIAAHNAGKTVASNPFRADSPEGMAWQHGWEDMRDVRVCANAEIGPSPYQTRAAETAEELAGLAASIAAQTREEGSDGDD